MRESCCSLEGNLFNPHIMMTTSNTYEFNPSRHHKQPTLTNPLRHDERKSNEINHV